jgi:sterol 24-C-methyltransferase
MFKLAFFMVVPTIMFTWVFMNGNPTQNVAKLLDLMKRGMAGSENVDKFDKVYAGVQGNQQHGQYDADVADSFYNLATEFYEYGWGDSFHFGFRTKFEPHGVAIANSQEFVANKLQVGDMDRVLDMGCGIGGPLRGVVRRTGANITGITINEFQVKRAYEITAKLTPWMQQRCHFVVQDYLDIKGMEENAYDAAFYMESSLHCEDRSKTFAETFRLLKPGGRLVAMEYVTLPGWDPSDKVQDELMRKHLHGNGAARTPTIEEDLAMFRAAGFEVKEHFDFMAQGDAMYGDQVWPWWADLQFNWWPNLLPAHPWVRTALPVILNALSAIGLVPEDVPKAAHLMNLGGDGLSGLGMHGAITPQYYVLAIKPLQ